MIGKIKKFISNNLEDLFIVMGLLIILGTTIYISIPIGLYLLGAILITVGILMSIYYPRIRGDDK